MDLAISKAVALSSLVDEALAGNVTDEERRYFTAFDRALPEAVLTSAVEDLRAELEHVRPADPVRYSLAALLTCRCALSTIRTSGVLAADEVPANRPVLRS
jgi:MFS-type transporter involved in bile tolerance (Atg22 family)